MTTDVTTSACAYDAPSVVDLTGNVSVGPLDEEGLGVKFEYSLDCPPAESPTGAIVDFSARATDTSAGFAIVCGVRFRWLRLMVWLLFCGVLAMGGAASAHATERQAAATDSVVRVRASGDGYDMRAVAKRGSPSLPFRGVIGFSGDVLVGGQVTSLDLTGVSLASPIGDGLLYRSTSDSTVAYVPLGDMRYLCGPGQILARSDGVEVVYVRAVGPHYAGYLIPWGDDAYPLFVSLSDTASLGGLPIVNVSDDFRVELVHDDETLTHGVLKISRGTEQRFYEGSLPGPRLLGSEYVAQPRAYYEPAVRLAGTDGEHYGYHITPNEPACGPQMTVVVSAVTGAPVMCGWDYLGPVLANLDESYPGVGDAVFPVDDPSESAASCDMSTRMGIRADIFDLGQNVSGGLEGAMP